MKCSAMKLHSRNEYKRDKIYRNNDDNHNSISYINEEFHNYSFSFMKKKRIHHFSEPALAINTIQFSDNFSSFNTGSSLEKWSKKRPRLKSSKRKLNETSYQDYSEDYEISFDVSNILNDLDDKYANDDDKNSTTYMEYDIHSDIEELIIKSQRDSEEMEKERMERKRRKKSSKIKTDDDKEKKKIKKKLKKTIKFSLSKPQSPETEQVIRVDVTSNMSIEDFENMENKGKLDNSKSPGKTIHDRSGENENRFIGLNEDDEDFIIRCRQLVISPKER